MSSTRHRHETREFLARYPEYRETGSIDRLRKAEYPALDRQGHTYLDYTGGSLYGISQLHEHLMFLSDNVLGNPHSHNPTSIAAEGWVDEARAATLDFFNASPDEYDVVFTSNASNAIRLVGESYPFRSASCYLMTADNHNSVNGVREFAKAAGTQVEYARIRGDDLRIDGEDLEARLARERACTHKLFAFPAQSNFSGVRHSTEWIDRAHSHGWDVLWDCAAFAPTSTVDLSAVKPEFAPVSFYKLFGYPTGVGALIAKHEALAKLERPWFSGGTILVVSTRNGWFHRAPGHMAFEDGTLDYASLPAVTFGLRYLKQVGIDVINLRVGLLASCLLDKMPALQHSNGAPLVRIFGPREYVDRGATIAFGLLDDRGRPYDVNRVELLAGRELISLRTGCFCNPGAREASHTLSQVELYDCFSSPESPVTPDECNRRIHERTGKLPSGIRVSLGIVSNIDDCLKLIDFLGGFKDKPAPEVGGDLYEAANALRPADLEFLGAVPQALRART